MPDAEKKILRKQLGNLRNAQDTETKISADTAICRNLAAIDKVREAETIAAYMPFGSEVDLTDFFAEFADKRLCFPREKKINAVEHGKIRYEMAEVPSGTFSATPNGVDNVFIQGRYGILEPKGEYPPISPEEINLWLIPGVGFDRKGNRLGYGGGNYDRMLEKAKGIKIGIGYEIQLVETLPTGSHDQRMDLIVTEKSVLHFNM